MTSLIFICDWGNLGLKFKLLALGSTLGCIIKSVWAWLDGAIFNRSCRYVSLIDGNWWIIIFIVTKCKLWCPLVVILNRRRSQRQIHKENKTRFHSFLFSLFYYYWATRTYCAIPSCVFRLLFGIICFFAFLDELLPSDEKEQNTRI